MIDKQDKSTVISFFPLPITEEKPGLYPGRFALPASNGKDPSLLIVGQSVHYVDVGEDRPLVEIPHQSVEIARSIVEDLIAAQLAISDGIRPGLAFLRGEYTLPELKTKHSAVLQKLRSEHRLWYQELVKLADDDWQKYHKHTVISDLQRIAARDLNLEREWLMASIESEPQFCPACGTRVQSGVVVCSSCRCIIDVAKYKTLTFAQ